VSPARRCAFVVLRRTFEDGAYADRALHAEARRSGLSGPDLRLATRLAYGAVQRRATLDHVGARLCERPLDALEPRVLAALRLGLFQLCFLDGVADHAAVTESVELAKGGRGGGHGLVNAVLRRAAREAPAILASLRDDSPEHAAIKHSHPEWVARSWWSTLGPDQARRLLAAGNLPAESAVRANVLVMGAGELAARLRADHGVASRPAEHLPEGLVLERPFDAHGSALWRAGAFTPQSRASMLAARVLDPPPGADVLDLCSAPGAKATHMAALMGDRGRIVAVERHLGRAGALKETVRRMRATCVTVHAGDAREAPAGGFDRVLVDPPCSGLGTLRSRPDLRWRASERAVAELAELQLEILGAGARALHPGGALVYCTCTISASENERLVERFLAENPDFEADDLQARYPLWKHPSVAGHLLLLPHRDGTDGFFIARLRRRP
jgi:16S rRNA (cytosine967-C5)-methyltransferase